MVIEYIKRSTSHGVGTTSGGDTETTIGSGIYILNQTAAATAGISVTHPGSGSGVQRLKFATPTNMPNQTDWGGGTITIYIRVTGTQPNLQITEIIARRLDSTLATVKASKSTGILTGVNLGTTQQTQTITWDDGTQNPSGRASTDRFEIVFRISNGSTMSTTGTMGGNTNTNTDEVDTPFDNSTARQVLGTISDTLTFTDSRVRAIGRSETITDSLTFTSNMVHVKATAPTPTTIIFAKTVSTSFVR